MIKNYLLLAFLLVTLNSFCQVEGLLGSKYFASEKIEPFQVEVNDTLQLLKFISPELMLTDFSLFIFEANALQVKICKPYSEAQKKGTEYYLYGFPKSYQMKIIGSQIELSYKFDKGDNSGTGKVKMIFDVYFSGENRDFLYLIRKS